MRGIIVILSPGLGFFVMSKVFFFFFKPKLEWQCGFFTAGTRDGARYAGAGGSFWLWFSPFLFFSEQRLCNGAKIVCCLWSRGRQC